MSAQRKDGWGIDVELTPDVCECWKWVLGTDNARVIARRVRAAHRRREVELFERYCRAAGDQRNLPGAMKGPQLLPMCCSVWAEQLEPPAPRDPLGILAARAAAGARPGLWNGAWTPLADRESEAERPSRLRRELARLVGKPGSVGDEELEEAVQEVIRARPRGLRLMGHDPFDAAPLGPSPLDLSWEMEGLGSGPRSRQ